MTGADEDQTEVRETLVYPPLASGGDIFPTLASSMGSKLWLGNQEAFSGNYWIVEVKVDD